MPAVKKNHGINGYRVRRCRCKVCVKAYTEHLARKRDQAKGRVRTDRLPSATNTLKHDTMTKEEYDRLRAGEISAPRKARGMGWLQ